MAARPAGQRRLAWAAALLFSLALIAALVLTGSPALDQAVNLALEPLRGPALTGLFTWISSLAAPPTATIIVLAASVLLWMKHRRAALPALWVLYFGVPASMEAIKLLVARPRPEPLAGIIETGYSFPSGTATIAAALYGFLAYLLIRELNSKRQRQALTAATALLIAAIAFSRLALSVHYLSDVVAGVLLGGLWVVVGVARAEWRQGEG
jgi:membrane-associated phospholipid phosphatase